LFSSLKKSRGEHAHDHGEGCCHDREHAHGHGEGCCHDGEHAERAAREEAVDDVTAGSAHDLHAPAAR